MDMLDRGPDVETLPPWGYLKTYIFGNLIIRASQIKLSASNPLVGVAVVSFAVGYPSTVLCKICVLKTGVWLVYRALFDHR